MAFLGDFGAAVREIKEPADADEFGFGGQRFRMPTGAPALAFMEFAAVASADDPSEMEQTAAVYGLLKDCIHPDDWDRFRKTVRAQGSTVDELLDLVKAVLEAVTGRPTSRPSDSSDGPPSTGPRLKVASGWPEDMAPVDELIAAHR